MRAMAPKADLRPFHHRARSAGSAATRTARAPWASRTSRTRCGLVVDASRQAVDLDEQHGGGVGRKAGVHVGLDHLDDGGVHHLQGGRDDAGGDDARSPRPRPRP